MEFGERKAAIAKMVAVETEKRIDRFFEPQVVVVLFRKGGILGMEGFRDRVDLFDPDVVGEDPIKGIVHLLAVEWGICGKMGDLSKRMYARVSTA